MIEGIFDNILKAPAQQSELTDCWGTGVIKGVHS